MEMLFRQRILNLFYSSFKINKQTNSSCVSSSIRHLYDYVKESSNLWKDSVYSIATLCDHQISVKYYVERKGLAKSIGTDARFLGTIFFKSVKVFIVVLFFRLFLFN